MLARIWRAAKHWYFSFYLNWTVYAILFATALLFVFSFFWPVLIDVPGILLMLLLVAVFADTVLMYAKNEGIAAQRITTHGRLSNGDENRITINVHNNYLFPVQTKVIDEVPPQLQWRKFSLSTRIKAKSKITLEYVLKPTERGEYVFGRVLVLATGVLRLVTRKFALGAEEVIPVYPSFIQMRKYELLAVSNRLSEAGVKRIRRLGQSTEFEQIKEYVQGDDYRTVNWKATARKSNLMVNTYTDEKSQQLYCAIDMGRSMKMPFEEMSLLDYAINSALVLINTALLRKDKAGLLTFANTAETFLPAARGSTQMERISENLYKQKTRFLESDYEQLYAQIRQRLKQRSLVVLYSNFETPYSMERQLPYLRAIAKYHLLLVVFFENTEVKKVTLQKPESMEGIYVKTIAEKMMHEKRVIEKQLQQNGILTLLTAPQSLTINIINKYLEIKARNIL